MGARLRVILNPEERRTLFELRKAIELPQRVRDRAEVVRLSHHGMYVEQIASYFNWNVRTVRETLKRWHDQGLAGLWDAPKTRSKKRPPNQCTNCPKPSGMLVTVQSVAL